MAVSGKNAGAASNSSAVRRDDRLAHPEGEAAKAASQEGWVKYRQQIQPQRGGTAWVGFVIFPATNGIKSVAS